MKYTAKLAAVVFLFISAMYAGKIGNTNALFVDQENVSGNTFGAGYWIPHLEMSVNPADPDGEDGAYKTKPCVTLTASITDPEDTTIWYRLQDSDTYTEYFDSCIEIPEGESNLRAYAIYDNNSEWKSNIVSKEFTVDLPDVTPTIEPGDVIINEVMWMGSDDKDNPSDDGPKDQWIELKNVSGHKLHLKGWYLTFKNKETGNENKLAEIGNDREVKDGEYFLLSHYNKSNSAIDEQRDDEMNNFDIEKFQIKLYTDKTKSVLIDTAGSGDKEPTKGNKTLFYSMERSSDPGNGSNYDNWYSCEDEDSSTYWDSGRLERGTPGNENMSDNDPAYAKTSTDEEGEPEENPSGSLLPATNGIEENPEIIEGQPAEEEVEEPVTEEPEDAAAGEDETGDLEEEDAAPLDPPAAKLPEEEPKAVEPVKEPEAPKTPEPLKETEPVKEIAPAESEEDAPADSVV